MRHLIVLVLAIYPVQCIAEDEWSTLDKSLFATYTVFNAVDILQTRYIFDSDDYHEVNPVIKPMGKNGSTAFMIGVNIGMYFVADALPKHRTTILGLTSALKIGVTAHNYSIGVGFKF